MSALFLHFVIGWVLSPWALIPLGVAALAAGFYFAPTQTLTVITNWRTWFVVAAVAGGIAFLRLEQQNSDLKKSNEALTVQVQTNAGATKALNAKIDNQKKVAVQVGRLQSVAAQAPEGKKEDAVLDQIAQDDGQPTQKPTPGPEFPIRSAPGGDDVDRVLDGGTGPRP